MKKKKTFKYDRYGADFMKKCALNSHIEVVREGKKPFKYSKSCNFSNKEFSKKVEL